MWTRAKNIFYYLTLPGIYLVSILPFPLLYLVSDGLFVFIFHIWGYRKKTVFRNLSRSFPYKSKSEIKALQSQYYRYLCDLFLETIKTLTISAKTMLKHCRLDDASLRLFENLNSTRQRI